VVTATYGHDWLEQYFKQRGPVVDSQHNQVKNYVRPCSSESEEIYRNIDVITLKCFTANKKNESRRK
jgi:hypothetical protein